MFYAIMKVEDSRVAKFMDFDNKADADTHVETFKDTYPDAFVYETDSPWSHIYVDENGASIQPPEVDNTAVYTAEQLFDLFETEYQDIYEASKTNKDVAFFFDKLRTRNRPIRADNPKLKQGLDLYVSLGLVDREKADSTISGKA